MGHETDMLGVGRASNATANGRTWGLKTSARDDAALSVLRQCVEKTYILVRNWYMYHRKTVPFWLLKSIGILQLMQK